MQSAILESFSYRLATEEAANVLVSVSLQKATTNNLMVLRVFRDVLCECTV